MKKPDPPEETKMWEEEFDGRALLAGLPEIVEPPTAREEVWSRLSASLGLPLYPPGVGGAADVPSSPASSAHLDGALAASKTASTIASSGTTPVLLKWAIAVGSMGVGLFVAVSSWSGLDRSRDDARMATAAPPPASVARPDVDPAASESVARPAISSHREAAGEAPTSSARRSTRPSSEKGHIAHPLARTAIFPGEDPPPTPAVEPPFPVESPLAQEARALAAIRSALRDGDAASALSSLGKLASRFPQSALSQEREVLAIEALVRLERMDEARLRAARFLAAHPESPHSSKVRSTVGPR